MGTTGKTLLVIWVTSAFTFALVAIATAFTQRIDFYAFEELGEMLVNAGIILTISLIALSGAVLCAQKVPLSLKKSFPIALVTIVVVGVTAFFSGRMVGQRQERVDLLASIYADQQIHCGAYDTLRYDFVSSDGRFERCLGTMITPTVERDDDGGYRTFSKGDDAYIEINDGQIYARSINDIGGILIDENHYLLDADVLAFKPIFSEAGNLLFVIADKQGPWGVYLNGELVVELGERKLISMKFDEEMPVLVLRNSDGSEETIHPSYNSELLKFGDFLTN